MLFAAGALFAIAGGVLAFFIKLKSELRGTAADRRSGAMEAGENEPATVERAGTNISLTVAEGSLAVSQDRFDTSGL